MTKTDVFKNLYVEDDKPTNSSIKDGYIYDYISGLPVKETPEEIEAVQPFSEILVEDYGYPKACIQTRPQWRVKARPSDNKKEYPVDIAIFSGAEHQDENISIVVECKKKNRKDGRSQLESYLRFSRAMLGVWFNGEERLYLQKIEKNGAVTFREIPNIPRYGERLEDVGKYKRKDLIPSDNLKPTFKTIRNYLAANAVGITRDEVFAAQIINLIFCKIYDERFTRQGVSQEIYDQYASKEDVQALDILLVRDGTYLVGASCLITQEDSKMLYCGGLLKIRSLDTDFLHPYLLLGLLNSYIVKRQIRTKQFTRDVIDTLGKRFLEIVLPIPKSVNVKESVISEIEEIVTSRTTAKMIIKKLAEQIC